jgi:murein L,D-transpeptidase YafK
MISSVTDRIPGTTHKRSVRPGVFLAAFFCCAPAFAAAPKHADKLIVHKKAHTLELMRNGSALRKYRVALGTEPTGPKTRQGDHKTPEGEYIIDRRNAHSRFYRALHISYPNAEDRVRAHKSGVPAGGDIMIHGLPNSYERLGSAHRLKDWTDGCIAVTNQEMDEIWRLVPDGTKVEILP